MTSPQYQDPKSGLKSRPREDVSAPPTGAVPARESSSLRDEVTERERIRFGGMKIGAGFFGWLSTIGAALLLTATAGAVAAAIGVAMNGDADQAANAAIQNADSASIVSAIVMLLIVFVAYLAGGYVAGRMARFNGAMQGLAVWLWAVVAALLIALTTALIGSQFDMQATLNSVPSIPVDEGSLTVVGITTAILLALVSLGGAILGGLAGMRYHRRVDEAGLGR